MWIDKLIDFINRHRTLKILKNFFEFIYIKTPILIALILIPVAFLSIILGNHIKLGVYKTFSASYENESIFTIQYDVGDEKNIEFYDNIYLYVKSEERYRVRIEQITDKTIYVSCDIDLMDKLKDKNINAIVQIGEQNVWQRVFNRKAGYK